MLKKVIEFEDLDGKTRTETFYFNLSKAELAEMELTDSKGGLANRLTDVVRSQDRGEIFKVFKWFVSKTYGVRDEDGVHFRKSDEEWRRFEQTEAYSVLLMDILTNEHSAVQFINEVIPKDLAPFAESDEGKALAGFSADIQDVPLPAEPEKKPWADREPTREELRNMSREEMFEVYERRSRNQ